MLSWQQAHYFLHYLTEGRDKGMTFLYYAIKFALKESSYSKSDQ